ATARQPRVRRQAIRLRFVHQQVEGIQPTQYLVVGAVEVGARDPLALQLVHPRLRILHELIPWAEANRLRRTGLGTRRRQAGPPAVVAERTLRGHELVRIAAHVDDAERTRRNAIAAAVARRLIDIHGIKLGAQDGPGRADLQARSIDTVLA